MTTSSKPFAGAGVAHRQREEAERDGQQNDVQHWMLPSDASPIVTDNATQFSMQGVDMHQRAKNVRGAPLPATDAIGFRDGTTANVIGISYRCSVRHDPLLHHRDCTDALKYAMFENGNRPEAVIMVPGVLELDMSARITPPTHQGQASL
jgi:hypothetical protein